MSKKILITWWLWYLWSHTVLEFIKKDCDIVIVDNLSNSSIDVLEKLESIGWKKIKFYKCDIQDLSWIENIFQENNFDGVVHFAWLKAVGESCTEPYQYYDNNIYWSTILFRIMDKYHVQKIVFSSSATVYDSLKNDIPFHEDWYLKTINPYGTTKLVLEHILEDLASHRWWDVFCLRYFNPIWAHPSRLLWESPKDVPNNLLPFIFRVVVWEQNIVKVFGDTYPTPDGTGVRDYIHVMDLAEAHLLAYENIEKESFQICNIWTGKGTSVIEMIQMVSDVIWKKIPYEVVDKRSWDVAFSIADVTKVKKILWRECKRTIKQAIEDTWNFIQETNKSPISSFKRATDLIQILDKN